MANFEMFDTRLDLSECDPDEYESLSHDVYISVLSLFSGFV